MPFIFPLKENDWHGLPPIRMSGTPYFSTISSTFNSVTLPNWIVFGKLCIVFAMAYLSISDARYVVMLAPMPRSAVCPPLMPSNNDNTLRSFSLSFGMKLKICLMVSIFQPLPKPLYCCVSLVTNS